MHSIGVVGSVAVSLLLGSAGGGVGGDFPVAVPRVAVDLAQVVPDSAVIVEGVLVLEDIRKRSAVGKLEGPSVAVGKLSPLLSVLAVGGKSLVDLGVSAIGRGSVEKVDVVVALVDNDGATDLGDGTSHQGCSCENGALHCDRELS